MPDISTGQVQGAMAEFQVTADDSGVDERSYPYCYWRKPALLPNGEPNPDAGYIVSGPAWPNEFKRAMKKGMVPLDSQYGEFHFPYDKKYAWRVTADPYWLLFAKGGAKEFTVKQVREHGWDRKPPYPDVVFPQLVGHPLEGEEAVCPICFKKMPNLPQREALLRNHVMVAHKEVSQHQQMTDAFSKANEKMTGNVQGPLAEVMALFATSIQQISQSLAVNAERQRLTDERLALVFERMSPPESVAAPAPAAEVAMPEPAAEVPEPESIIYTAPSPDEAPRLTRKK